MVNARSFAHFGIAVLATARVASSQQPGLPPVRDLGRVLARLTDTVTYGFQLRPLSDGRILVQNYAANNVALYDSSFARADTVLGKPGTAVQANANGAMLAWSADTTLIVDQRAVALLHIDPAGRVVRTTALPPFEVALSLGASAPDLHGRLVFVQRETRMHPTRDPSGKGPPIYVWSDSIPIVRFHVASLRVDTVAYVHGPHNYPIQRTIDPDGTVWDTDVINPLPQPDGWAVLSDGTIALLRAHDYHIDWINADGVRTSSAALPHQWYRYSDSERVAIIDSVSSAAAKHPRLQYSETDTSKKRPYVPLLPNPDDLPTYETAFVGSLYADRDDNLWIREKRSGPDAGGSPVYEIVNPQGRLIDRVRVPGGTTILGFGPGVVYLIERLGHGLSVARVSIR